MDLYRVGSKDESTVQTGVSHWVEHIAVSKAHLIPDSVLDKAISREGGQWNAFTFLGWTTYYETMPSARIDLALRLEADRMVNSMFNAGGSRLRRNGDYFGREGSENEPLFQLAKPCSRPPSASTHTTTKLSVYGRPAQPDARPALQPLRNYTAQ